MTCKDCIHEKVCDALIKRGCPWLEEEYSADKFCFEFKNKADVVEVIHGEWESYPNNLYRRCSVCKREYYTELNRYKGNYCPNCGAKMDGKKVE